MSILRKFDDLDDLDFIEDLHITERDNYRLEIVRDNLL